jgi:hypothetical protein
MKKPERALSPRIRKILIVCAVLWLAYLVGVNWLINSDLLVSLIGKSPERTKISWDRAWSVVPGLVHVRGFSIWKHTRGTQWSLQVERGRVMANLLALPFATFQALTARASGIEFEIGKADTVLPRKAKTKPGFRIHFLRAAARDVRSVKVGNFELVGPMRAGGSFSTQTRGPLRVPRGRLRIESGTLKAAEMDLARDLEIDARISIDKHVPREHKGAKILPFVEARVKLKGEIQDLAILDQLLLDVDKVTFGGGSGKIDADVQLDRGVVEPSSRLVTEEATYTVDYLGYRVTGTGRIFAFSAADTEIDEYLRFDFEDFGLAVRDDDSPYLNGNALSLSLRREGGWKVAGPNPRPDIVVDMAEATVPDMTAYNRVLPANGAVRIISGTGTVSSHVEFLERSGGGSAKVDLTADGLVVDLKDKRIVGDLRSMTRVAVVDAENMIFDPTGTRIEIRNAAAIVEDDGKDGHDAAPAPEENWWCDLNLTSGRAEIARPPRVSADFTIESASAEPVFALLAKSQKKANKMERRFETDDLTGHGRLGLEGGAFSISDIEVSAGNAAVRADFCMQDKGLHGLLHIKYGALAVGIGLEGNKESYHITRPKRWFERNRELFVCGQ